MGGHSTPIYLSTDAGSTWTVANTPTNYWRALASSADGSKLIALSDPSQDGLTYRSTNSGADWTAVNVNTNNPWRSVACSADGNMVVAAARGAGIYRSLDAGATWTLTSAPPTNYWISIASSADGKKLAAIHPNYSVPGMFIPGTVYLSIDSGDTWLKTNSPDGLWDSIACSADGTTVIAGGPGVFFSTNSWKTWNMASSPDPSPCVASSADGTRLAAAGYPGQIYFSTNSGATWNATGSGSHNWLAIKTTADGNLWIAIDAGSGTVYKTQADSSPSLGVSPGGGMLNLSWLIASPGFTLEQTSDLASGEWAVVPDPPSLDCTNLVYNYPAACTNNSQTFYRLAHH